MKISLTGLPLRGKPHLQKIEFLKRAHDLSGICDVMAIFVYRTYHFEFGVFLNKDFSSISLQNLGIHQIWRDKTS